MLTTTLLVAISIFDFLRHRIPNGFLLLLLCSILVSGEITVRPHYAAVVLMLALLGYWKFGLGAGDVKLLFLIALFLTPAKLATAYWFYFSIIGFGHISLKWLANHSLKGNIALAPAICGAVLCISWISRI